MKVDHGVCLCIRLAADSTGLTGCGLELWVIEQAYCLVFAESYCEGSRRFALRTRFGGRFAGNSVPPIPHCNSWDVTVFRLISNCLRKFS